MAKLGDMSRAALMSLSLATSETLHRATKFVARDTQMFLEDNKHFLSPQHANVSGHMLLACHSHV